MNAGLLKEIAGGMVRTMPPREALDRLRHWLGSFGYTGRIVAAGKNFASFDLQFLKRLWPGECGMFHYRSLDPMMLFVRPDDEEPPNTEECLKRAGLPSTVTHDAVDDARNVVALIRAGMIGGH
jgi:hypothetical protein